MYIIMTTPIAVCVIVYAIYKWIMRQSAREKEFWWDQKHLRGGRGCRLYAIVKAILLFVAIAGAMLIGVSLIYGQVPTLRDFTNEKFQIAFLGAGFLIFIQLAPLGMIHLLKHVSKLNLGKVILFFIIIGSITAVLITGICLAAF